MTTKNIPAEGQTFEQQVNSAVDSMVAAEDGSLSLPEDHGLSENLVYSANAERRRRDTQAAFSRSQNEVKRLKDENSALAKGWEKDVASVLSAEQSAELEELKATDPDAWRAKLNEYEAANATSLSDKQGTIKKDAAQGTELERRTTLLDEFNTANPDMQITDDLLANEVPPKYLKQLEAGEVTFEQLLDNVKTFLTSGKVIKGGAKPHEDIDMSKAGGSHVPAAGAVDKDAATSYAKELY